MYRYRVDYSIGHCLIDHTVVEIPSKSFDKAATAAMRKIKKLYSRQPLIHIAISCVRFICCA